MLGIGSGRGKHPRKNEEKRSTRRRRIRDALATIRGRVTEICGRIERVDDLLGLINEIRAFLEKPEVQEVMPYRGRRRLNQVIGWIDKAKDKTEAAGDACTRVQEALDYADVVLNPKSLMDHVRDRVVDRAYEKLASVGPVTGGSVAAIVVAGSVTAAILLSNGDPTVETIVVSGVPSVPPEPGREVRLGALLLDDEGNRLDEREVEWASTRPSVATVSQDGLVLAVSDGVTTIIATSDGTSGRADFEVLETVASPRVDLAAGSLSANDTTVTRGQQISVSWNRIPDRFALEMTDSDGVVPDPANRDRGRPRGIRGSLPGGSER